MGIQIAIHNNCERMADTVKKGKISMWLQSEESCARRKKTLSDISVLFQPEEVSLTSESAIFYRADSSGSTMRSYG